MITDTGRADAQPSAISIRRAWFVAAVLTACFTLSYIDRQIISILVGPIKQSLSLSDTQLGLLQGVSFSLFYVAASLPLARLSDRGNRTRIMGSCIAVWSFMTMLCGMAGQFWHLMLARIGVASAEAGMPPAALTMMADLFDAKRLVRATSIFMLAPFLGGGIALLGGGTLYGATAHWTMPVVPGLGQLERWQLMFMLVGAPGLLAAAVVFSLTDPRRRRAVSTQGGGFSELLHFIRHERRFAAVYVLAVALVSMLLSCYSAWLPAAMIRSKGVDERQIGLLFGPVFLLSGAAGTLLGGVLIGRGAQEVVERTFRFMRAAICVVFPLAIVGPLVPSLALELTLMGGAIFLISSIIGMCSLPFQYVAPAHLRAQAIALMGLIAALFGTGLGPLIVGMLSDTLPGGNQSLSYALAVIAAVAIPAVVLLMHIVIRQYRAANLPGWQAKDATAAEDRRLGPND